MFRAIKQHVTGTYRGKKRHGMNLTKCIEQKSFTDHEPKRIRRYDGTHVNMASYMTDAYMAGTTISKHIGELEPLTTEKYMAWQGNQQIEDMFMMLRLARTSS